MVKLMETLRERRGKPIYLIVGFFNNLMKRGELVAHSIEIDRIVVERDTAEERVTRTIKGATLIPTDEIRDNCSYILDRSGRRYHLNTKVYGGMFYDEGNSQTVYHNCILERLASNFDLKMVSKANGDYHTKILIPREMIDGRLRAYYSEDSEDDEVVSSRGSLYIDGENDELFEAVRKFIIN